MSNQIKDRRMGMRRRETRVQNRKLQGYMAKIAVTKSRENETARIFKKAFVLILLPYNSLGKKE